MAHKFPSVSVFVGLVVVRDVFLPRPLQQGKYVGYVVVYLFPEVITRRVAVVPPALCLHDQQVEKRHHRNVVDDEDIFL